VLKYQPGQKYEEHWDWFEEEERKKMDIDDTNRIATILVYLSGGDLSDHAAWSSH
jgi:prolyl 4-hydroxylase